MARLPPLWQQANAYRAQEDRGLIGTVWPVGGVTGMVPNVVNGTMGIQIGAGVAACPDTRVPGAAYLCRSDAPETVTLATAPPAGTDRIDLIVVRPRDSQFAGSDNDFVFDPVVGVPAANPVVPAVPAGTAVIVQQRVIGGAAFIGAGNMVDRRVGLNMAAEPPTASAPAVFRQDWAGDWWVARSNVAGGAWRRARDYLRASYFRGAAFNYTAGVWIALGYDSQVTDPYALYNPGSGVFTVPVTGVWRLVQGTGGLTNAVNQWVQAGIATLDGVTTLRLNLAASAVAGVNVAAVATWEDVLTAGAAYLTRVASNAAIAGRAFRDTTFFNATFVSPA